MRNQPMQALEFDDEEIVRFRDNKIVRYLLDTGGVNLNALAKISYLFPRCDWEQFYQLIGYSVGGYIDLSNVSEESKKIAEDLGKCLKT